MISRAPNKNNLVYWHCRCDCGIEKDVRSASLIKGTSTNCGCKRKQNLSKSLIDMSGQKYGKLTVLEYNKNQYKWECKCDCGNIINVNSSSLTMGLTQSCGCLKSKGEEKIIQLLKENNIPFKYQKFFDTCIFDTKNKARFDFYINNKYIIEYDGEQHFGYTKNEWNTKEHFEKLQARDIYKNNWCKENNIPLIRIPYTRYDNLCIEDLLLETSQFII